MNSSEIAINSEKMAQFLGATRNFGEYELYGIIESIEDGECEKHFYQPNEMEFHNSLDWLQDVINKVESEGYNVDINNSTCKISDENITISLTLKNTRKSLIVFQALSIFIDWYNQEIL